MFHKRAIRAQLLQSHFQICQVGCTRAGGSSEAPCKAERNLLGVVSRVSMSSLSRRLAAVLAAALLPHMLPGNLLTVRLRGQLLGNRRAKVCIQATELMFFFYGGACNLTRIGVWLKLEIWSKGGAQRVLECLLQLFDCVLPKPQALHQTRPGSRGTTRGWNSGVFKVQCLQAAPETEAAVSAAMGGQPTATAQMLSKLDLSDAPHPRHG